MRGQSPLRLEIMVRGEDRLMDVQYERRRRRVKMSRQVRVRPSSPVDKHFEEVRATVSASPDGLYFTTWRDAYYQGMRLLITFPYSSERSEERRVGKECRSRWSPYH